MNASPKCEILACRNEKHVSKGKSRDKLEDFLLINGKNVACYPARRQERPLKGAHKVERHISHTLCVIAFLAGGP